MKDLFDCCDITDYIILLDSFPALLDVTVDMTLDNVPSVSPLLNPIVALFMSHENETP